MTKRVTSRLPPRLATWLLHMLTRRIPLSVLAAFATICNPVFGQDRATGAMAALNIVLPRAAQERLALSAAPEHLRAGATVYVFGKTGFEQTRGGTNGFTCLVNRDAFFYGAAQFMLAGDVDVDPATGVVTKQVFPGITCSMPIR
jgi:hypothetical protein